MWLVYPALSCVLVLMPGTGWLLVLLAAIGCISGAYDPVEVTIHQELISPDLRARAFAVLLAAEMSVVPLLMLLYGFLFDAAGLRPALLLFAASNVLLGGYAIGNRSARLLYPAGTVSP